MKKTIPVTFSGNVLNFSLPDAWEKLSQEQLRYVCYVMVNFEGITAKTYIFIRLLGIRVISKVKNGWVCSVKLDRNKIRFFLEEWQIVSFLQVLNFIDKPSISPICIARIGKFHAVDILLHGIPFRTYISLENLYQGYLQTNNSELLKKMAQIFYVDAKGRHPELSLFSESELLSVFLWFASLKNHFSICFPCFFKSSGGEGDVPDMISVMNAEIRALTGGDITKENQVLNMDCWRALTELNEKAREAQEFKEKYGHK